MCHQSYLLSQHFYTLAALCDSETASRSKVEGARSLEVAMKMAFGWQFSPGTFRLSQQLLLTPLPCWKVGICMTVEDCELGGSSCDSRIMVSV